MHMAETRNIRSVAREASLVFTIDIRYRLGHTKRQRGAWEDMSAVNCSYQWIHKIQNVCSALAQRQLGQGKTSQDLRDPRHGQASW